MTIRKTLVALACALPVLVFAQDATPRVDQRAANQQQRIERGAAAGTLTVRETNRLERGQRHVANVESRAKADGVVTRRERARLHQAQAVENRRIKAQKHDRQRDVNHDGRIDRRHRY